MENTRRERINIENKDIRKLLFMNLSGAEDEFHKGGQTPNFYVVLTREKAEELSRMGFNIKEKEDRDGDIEYRLQVFARYDLFPPKIFMVTSTGRTLLDEMTVKELDYADIAECDIVINPYYWTVNDNTGIKAYIDRAYFKVMEDAFASKYAD